MRFTWPAWDQTTFWYAQFANLVSAAIALVFLRNPFCSTNLWENTGLLDAKFGKTRFWFAFVAVWQKKHFLQ